MGPEGPTTEPQAPTTWCVYLRTADIEQTVARAVEAGAQIMVPSMPIADLGTMAIIVDPAGAVVGLWQPDTFEGIANSTQVGTPCWFENMTMDFDAASSFYRDVLAWELHANPTQQEATPTVRYLTHGTGDETAAGISEAAGFLPEGTPSYWRIYFGVADMDASLEQLVRLGGAVLDPGSDTPFGRIATVADPQGAQFQLLEIANWQGVVAHPVGVVVHPELGRHDQQHVVGLRDHRRRGQQRERPPAGRPAQVPVSCS